MIENQNDFRSKKINETENVEKRRKIDKNNLNSNVPRYTKLFRLNTIIFFRSVRWKKNFVQSMKPL